MMDAEERMKVNPLDRLVWQTMESNITRRRTTGNRITPELRARVLADMAEGKSINWILVHRHVSRATVRKIRDQAQE